MEGWMKMAKKKTSPPPPQEVKPLTDEERADAYGNRIFGVTMMLAKMNRDDIESRKHDPVRLIEFGERMLKRGHEADRLARICKVAWAVGGWRRFFLGHSHPDYRQGIDVLNGVADACMDFMLTQARHPYRSTSAIHNLSAQCEAEAAHEVWAMLRGRPLDRGILPEIEKEPFTPKP